MQQPREVGAPNPHDLMLHKQLKEIFDQLKPELLRLYQSPSESSGNLKLYHAFVDQVRAVKKEVTNHDALFAFQNILSQMKKVVDLTEKHSPNQEILWRLQEIMAILCKVQNLPS